jgi:hypothetical protein
LNPDRRPTPAVRRRPAGSRFLSKKLCPKTAFEQYESLFLATHIPEKRKVVMF